MKEAFQFVVFAAFALYAALCAAEATDVLARLGWCVGFAGCAAGALTVTLYVNRLMK